VDNSKSDELMRQNMYNEIFCIENHVYIDCYKEKFLIKVLKIQKCRQFNS